MDKTLIIGAGEVGTALKEILKDVHKVEIRDIEAFKPGHFKVLHICYPYSKKFKEETYHYIRHHAPELVIIHSTVPPGTTASIDGPCVHSPIIGRHPGLVEAIKTFTKMVGGPSDLCYKAGEHMFRAGINISHFSDAKTTELAKLLDTTYYGFCLVWHQEAARICKEQGVSPDDVKKYNRIYNKGYADTGLEVQRPILDNIEWRGHCIENNLEMLRGYVYDSPLLEAMVDSNELAKVKK